MQVQNNPNVNFGSNKEILYNLGNALHAAQMAARNLSAPIGSDARSNVGIELASLRAYLDSATEDESFLGFITFFREHLSTKINAKPERARKPKTLSEIAHNTAYLGRDANLNVRAVGFKIFEQKFLHMIKEKLLYGKDPEMKGFKAFLDAIKPSITPSDMASELETRIFHHKLEANFDEFA